MVINTTILDKAGIKWKDNELIVLNLIKQKDYDVLEGCAETIEKLAEKNFISYIKDTKPPDYKRARITKKGRSFLNYVEIPEISQKSWNLAKDLLSLYKNNDLRINNKKQVYEMVAWFLNETGYEPKEVYNTVEEYINSTEPKFTSSLNNLIWKGQSVYSAKWKLSESKLYSLMT